jgi:hypothetical protein
MRIAALKILNEHDIGVAGEFLFIHQFGLLWGTPALMGISMIRFMIGSNKYSIP